MYTQRLAVNMATLYWRIKKNGKWTWKPLNQHCDQCNVRICTMEGVLCETQERVQWLLQEEE